MNLSIRPLLTTCFLLLACNSGASSPDSSDETAVDGSEDDTTANLEEGGGDGDTTGGDGDGGDGDGGDGDSTGGDGDSGDGDSAGGDGDGDAPCGWSYQVGTVGNDRASGVVTDSTGAVIIVATSPALNASNPTYEHDEILVIKLTSAGEEVWSKRFTSLDWDTGRGVTVDAEDNIYVVGETSDNLNGETPVSLHSAFLMKLTPDGDEVWTRLFGSFNGNNGWDVSVDHEQNVYVGATSSGSQLDPDPSWDRDPMLVKFDPDGNQIWLREDGTADSDSIYAIATASDGSVYAVGSSSGWVGGQQPAGAEDVLVMKYDSEGNQQWVDFFGAEYLDGAWSVVVDDDFDVYVAGTVSGALPGQSSLGQDDLFLRKYTSAGEELWTRQFGSQGSDHRAIVDIGPDGNIYVSGNTQDSIPDFQRPAEDGMLLTKFTPDGEQLLHHEFGTLESDDPSNMHIDPQGQIYIVGSTQGSFDPDYELTGFIDLFVINVCEPESGK